MLTSNSNVSDVIQRILRRNIIDHESSFSFISIKLIEDFHVFVDNLFGQILKQTPISTQVVDIKDLR